MKEFYLLEGSKLASGKGRGYNFIRKTVIQECFE
jgi:hypothetical protein